MKSGCFGRLVRILVLIVTVPLLVFAVTVTVMYYSVRHRVPDISPLKDHTPMASTRVLDRTGVTLGVYQDPRIRIWAHLDQVPRDVIGAITSAEDPNFFKHTGMDLEAIWEAVKIDLQNMAYVRGASTITQQTMKNLFLTREKTLTRKIKEAVLAKEVEKLLTKRQILEQYLNQVEWGENLYGIEAASRYYLGKPVDQLRVHEGALLAGMLPNPRFFNPYVRLDRLRIRQRIILQLMWKYRLLTKAQYEEALGQPNILASSDSRPYPAASLKTRYRPKPVGYHLIMDETLESHLGPFLLWQGGLTLRTSLDLETMRQAEKILGRPDKLIDMRFAVLRRGTAIVAFGMAPAKGDADFDKWLAERSLQCEIVKKTLPWDQIIVERSRGGE